MTTLPFTKCSHLTHLLKSISVLAELGFVFFFMSTTTRPREEISIEQLTYCDECMVPRYYDLECER